VFEGWNVARFSFCCHLKVRSGYKRKECKFRTQDRETK
jgi:hypothetical protein